MTGILYRWKDSPWTDSHGEYFYVLWSMDDKMLLIYERKIFKIKYVV